VGKIRKFDARTILFNTMYDAKRMLDSDVPAKKVASHIKKKIEFLEKPGGGNEIRWD
jgi:hypothetical protein